jgi:hypothetical protein
MKIKSFRTLAVALGAACFLTVAAFAGDPTGSWSWSTPGRNGGPPRTAKLTLALKDGALTGSMAGRGGEVAIGDASFKDDAIAFSITREFNGNSMTTKYTGKLDGDTIKGSIELPAMGDNPSRKMDWSATRGAAAAAPAAAPAP